MFGLRIWKQFKRTALAPAEVSLALSEGGTSYVDSMSLLEFCPVLGHVDSHRASLILSLFYSTPGIVSFLWAGGREWKMFYIWKSLQAVHSVPILSLGWVLCASSGTCGAGCVHKCGIASGYITCSSYPLSRQSGVQGLKKGFHFMTRKPKNPMVYDQKAIRSQFI